MQNICSGTTVIICIRVSPWPLLYFKICRLIVIYSFFHQILSKAAGVPFQEVKTFLELQEYLKYSFSDLLDLIKKTLHEEKYTRSEVLEKLEISDDSLKSTLLTKNTLAGNAE